MSEEASLEFELLINPAKRRIILNGDLDEQPGMEITFQDVGFILNSAGGRWTVDASDARMIPKGVELWSRATRQYFPLCFFDYLDDQLGTILEYDDVYRAAHPHDTFHKHK